MKVKKIETNFLSNMTSINIYEILIVNSIIKSIILQCYFISNNMINKYY